MLSPAFFLLLSFVTSRTHRRPGGGSRKGTPLTTGGIIGMACGIGVFIIIFITMFTLILCPCGKCKQCMGRKEPVENEKSSASLPEADGKSKYAQEPNYQFNQGMNYVPQQVVPTVPGQTVYGVPNPVYNNPYGVPQQQVPYGQANPPQQTMYAPQPMPNEVTQNG
ncbi:hypothetical protein TRFO_09857 [Tritrichomonas foetus]|uniref:Uncharacterized protein n=1 Tax=Tritrichomonas foetus TaxID=1144522 RepID=A0A1J4JHE8_9EUKA|nr:hypothetical protein TRFO_09857 [Tritrichomonas foetus]|eukprot:OHS96692.1 hypothetical protein TRFO_09857 [Tritrichomonas foetus]